MSAFLSFTKVEKFVLESNSLVQSLWFAFLEHCYLVRLKAVMYGGLPICIIVESHRSRLKVQPISGRLLNLSWVSVSPHVNWGCGLLSELNETIHLKYTQELATVYWALGSLLEWRSSSACCLLCSFFLIWHTPYGIGNDRKFTLTCSRYC